jgi:hypothetical protein
MKKALYILIVAAVFGATAINTQAGGIKYTTEDGDAYLKLGGRIQLQYHYTDPSGGESEDDLLFRRLRPYIEGSSHPDWKAKVQFDFGKNKTEVKDAYFQYKGYDGMKVSVGNMNFPFSRELLTSSKKQQLVERTFVGDHNYGTPDRQAGLHVEGSVADDLLVWNAAAAVGSVDPSNKKLDFDTAISLNKGDDWSDGPMAGGRLEFFPLGKFKPEQGDFKGEPKLAVAVAGFAWQNDDDNLTPANSNDVDNVVGIEVSAAFRGGGLSVDAEYNSFDSELSQEGITSGLYVDSETTLENWSVEGGFMVVPSTLELVAGYQSQDADGYAEAWNRISVGLNYFMAKHDIKYQLTYQVGENKDGKDGNDVDEVFVQAQYVF